MIVYALELALFAAAPLALALLGTRALGGELRGLARPLATFVLWASLVVAIVVGLGLAAALTRELALVALSLGLAAAAVMAVARARARRSEIGPSGDSGRGAELHPALGGLLAAAAVLAAGVVGLVALEGFRNPPLAYDALMYHLVFPAEWIQRGQLVLVPTWFVEPANSYFPCHASALAAYLMLATGDERLVNLVQLPFLLAGAAALAGIARRLGCGRAAAALVALLFMASPEVATQAGSALADLVFGAALLLVCFFLLEYRDSGARAAAAAAGAALGLLLGSKAIALLFGALLVPLALAVAWSRRRQSGLGRLVGDGLCLAAAALPLGSLWYLRNAWATGNPLFPLEVAIGGLKLFAGAHGRAEMLASHFHAPAPAAALHALNQLWGPFLGAGGRGVPLLLALLVLALLAGGWRFGARGRDRLTPAGLVLLPLALVAAFAALNPYNTQYRFLIPAYALSLLPLAALVERPGRAGRLLAAAALVAVALAIALWGRGQDPRLEVFALPWRTLLSASVAAGAAGSLLARRRAAAGVVAAHRLLRVPASLLAGLTATVAVLLALLQPGAARSYAAFAGTDVTGQRARLFARVRELGGGCVIAYAGFNQPYPLYGRDFSNRVVYAAVDGRQGFNLEDYLALPAGDIAPRRSYKPMYYRQQPSEQRWLHALDALAVDYLVVSRFIRWDQQEYAHDADGFPWEEAWARHQPLHFRLVFETADLRLYRLGPGSGSCRGIVPGLGALPPHPLRAD